MAREREAAAGPSRLEEIERHRGHLWATVFVVMVALASAVFFATTEPATTDSSEILGLPAPRFALVAIAAVVILYALERERTFRSLTRSLVEQGARGRALEMRLREVSALADVAKALAGMQDEEEMQSHLVSSTCALLGTPYGVLLVPDGDAGVLRPRAATGPERSSWATDVPREGILERVVRERRGAIVSAGAGVPWGAAGGTSAVAVPIAAADALIGVLWAGTDSRALGDYELRFAQLFAEHAATAIANLRAYAHERASVSRLAEIDRMKSDFVATITHELKTPLTSLLGYATILRRRGDTLSPEQREEFFSIMSRQGARILRLVEELLQSSRIEAGFGRLRREPLHLADIVRNAIDELESVARDHEIVAQTPGHDLGLYGDPIAIEHVLTNLLDNAIKYSPPGSRITVRVEDAESEVRLSVSDEGPGIPVDDQPYIFERFRQAPGTRGGGRASVGLGLYIVRSLVEAHGGTVWVESDLGKGTTFTLSLPRRRARDGGDAAEEEEPPPGPTEEGGAEVLPISTADPIDFPA